MSGEIELRGLRRDGRETVMLLRREGWEPERWCGSGHLLLRHESGATTTLPCSSGDAMARTVAIRQARRAVRQAEARGSRA